MALTPLRLRAILFAVEKRAALRIGFLFDMDGVLINSMPLHTHSWEMYLAKHGVQVEDLEARLHGKRNPELVRELFGEGLSESEIFEHGRAKEALFRELMAGQFEEFVIPGLSSFLQRFSEIPKAIASNAEPANISFVLDRLGIAGQFAAVVDGTQVERPKPFPDIYLLAAQRLGLPPSECVVFEDSPVGAAAGRAAGMRTVGVETIPTTFENVDLVIRDFNDQRLESWLQAEASLRTSGAHQ